jgi:hypothetical protein
MNLRRLSTALAAAAAVAAVAVVPAAAKGGVKATLLSSIPLDAKAGTHVTVSWKLFSTNAGGRRVPFGAGGVFIRLRSASGSGPKQALASATGPGRYRATVTVPDGGIGGVQIGLHGWTNGPSGTHRADVFFPVSNASFSFGRVELHASAHGRNWVAVATAAFLGAIAFSLLLLRRRGRSRQALGRSGSSPSP